MKSALAASIVLTVLPIHSAHGDASCPSPEVTSLDELVARVDADHVKYVFIGERHGVGPVKRFAVEAANALVEAGHHVGLYVEGFRVDCPPRDDTCWSLARAFNGQAFRTLLEESRASVHAIDPPEAGLRAAKMAAVIAGGSESVRVVLVGNSHVVHAEDPDAEWWVWGGGLRYPDPGDLAEQFPRREYLTVGLETAPAVGPPYSLRRDGCGFDYVLTTEDTEEYWGPLADSDRVAETGEAGRKAPAASIR